MKNNQESLLKKMKRCRAHPGPFWAGASAYWRPVASTLPLWALRMASPRRVSLGSPRPPHTPWLGRSSPHLWLTGLPQSFHGTCKSHFPLRIKTLLFSPPAFIAILDAHSFLSSLAFKAHHLNSSFINMLLPHALSTSLRWQNSQPQINLNV